MSNSIARTPKPHVDAPLIPLAYIVTLFTKPAQFYKYLSKIKIPPGDRPEFLDVEDGEDAVVHFIKTPDKVRHAIVCVSDQTGESITKIMALLVHEAVHIWQYHCEYMGETEPSREFEAYSIQAISQLLIEAYADAA